MSNPPVRLTAKRASLSPTAMYLGALALPIAAWALFVAPAPSAAAYIGLGIIAVAALSLASDALAGRLGPMSLTFWSFIAVWSGIAPLYQLKSGTLPWKDVPADDLYGWAQLLTLVAVLAYRLGQLLARASNPRRRIPPKVEPRIIFAGLVLPALAFPLAALSGVSLSSRFQSRDDLIDAFAAQGLEYSSSGGALLGILKTLPICLAAVGLYVVAREIHHRRVSGKTIGAGLIVPLIISLGSAITFANPLSNSRFQAFSVILILLFVFASFATLARRTALVVGLLLGLLVAYPLTAVFKNEAIAQRVSLDASTFASVDFDGFQQTVNSLWYVQQNGFTFGHHLISALGFFIPRSVWEWKALPASFPVAESRGYVFQNLALPIWSEMYVEFGTIGMILVMVLIGLFSRRVDLTFVQGDFTRLSAIAPVLAGVQIGVLRGPLGAQIVFAATLIALATVSYRRVKQPTPLELRSTTT